MQYCSRIKPRHVAQVLEFNASADFGVACSFRQSHQQHQFSAGSNPKVTIYVPCCPSHNRVEGQRSIKQTRLLQTLEDFSLEGRTKGHITHWSLPCVQGSFLVGTFGIPIQIECAADTFVSRGVEISTEYVLSSLNIPEWNLLLWCCAHKWLQQPPQHLRCSRKVNHHNLTKTLCIHTAECIRKVF